MDRPALLAGTPGERCIIIATHTRSAHAPPSTRQRPFVTACRMALTLHPTPSENGLPKTDVAKTPTRSVLPASRDERQESGAALRSVSRLLIRTMSASEMEALRSRIDALQGAAERGGEACARR